jgi:hypothetical protein
MYLTKENIETLPASACESIYHLKLAISTKYSVGISDETARRILNDFAKA